MNRILEFIDDNYCLVWFLAFMGAVILWVHIAYE